jgi:hypothetical protein
MCRDLFKDIFQKVYHRQKKCQGNEEACSVLQKQYKEGDSAWCPKFEAALCVEESFKAFHNKLNFLGKILLRIQIT